MQKIIVKKTISSNISSNPLLKGDGCISIEINGSSIYNGEYSAIYKVVNINRVPVQKLLCKTYNDGFPSTLENIIKQIGKNNERVKECKPLRALPLFLFEGSLNGVYCSGFIMNEVNGIIFKDIIENNEELSKYLRLPLDTRLKICLQFAEAMETLRQASILHSDLKFDNMMIDVTNKDSPDFYLIDIDAGVTTITKEVPISEMNDQIDILPPETWKQKLKKSKGQVTVDKFIFDRNSENWAIAASIHCLLFGVNPSFFLKDIQDFEEYLKKNEWPEINNPVRSEFQYPKTYRSYKANFSRLFIDLQKKFKTTFQKGYYHYGNRATPYQFVTEIRKQLKSGNVFISYTPKRHPTSTPSKPQPKPLLMTPSKFKPSTTSTKSFAKIITKFFRISIISKAKIATKLRTSRKIITPILIFSVLLLLSLIFFLPKISNLNKNKVMPTNTTSNSAQSSINLIKVYLLSPQDGSMLSLGNITFSWSPVSDAAKYELIIYYQNGDVTLDEIDSSTSFTVTLKREGTFTWKVSAGDNKGNWGPWSNISSLLIKNNAQTTVAFKVDSVPSRAKVYVDGKSYGVTPLNLNITTGKHEVKITKEGYEDSINKVYPETGKDLTVKLTPKVTSQVKNGSLAVDSNPSGALVYINNELISTPTPLIGYALKPGTYSLKISKFGYIDYTTTIEMKSGEAKDLGSIHLQTP